uniref:Uncharacterized protein n=1 Tax=Rhizophora mucronata TaxID=61149 RepID=A0A2P2JDQ6_RHIMU
MTAKIAAKVLKTLSTLLPLSS